MSTTYTRPRDGWTPAQWFCLVVGPTLVAAGLLGFIADATFDADNGVQGDTLLGLEVNGWHNVVHILSGLLLLAGTRAGAQARTVALLFGGAYAVVTVIGLIDGNDVLGFMPVNAADNVLHLVLAVLAFATAAVSRDEAVDRRGLGQDRADDDARAGIAGTTDRDERLGGRVSPGDRTSR